MSLSFNNTVKVGCSFSSKEQGSFNFIAAVTISSDFGAQKDKVCHCCHCFPIYLPWSDGTGCHDLHFLNVESFFFFFKLYIIVLVLPNIKNLRYADDTTLMAESEEELQSLLKEESEKVGLKLNIQKTKITAFQSHHFMAYRWGNNGNSDRLYFLGLQNHCRWWL